YLSVARRDNFQAVMIPFKSCMSPFTENSYTGTVLCLGRGYLPPITIYLTKRQWTVWGCPTQTALLARLSGALTLPYSDTPLQSSLILRVVNGLRLMALYIYASCMVP